jgi:DNA-binding winged helix-turn-helix (wHTH) protein
MAESAKFPVRVRFGVYEADLVTGELRKGGRRIRLTGRPFQILALLLERPGALVTREEIRTQLWPADTFVDFEHGMNSAIRKMRDALGDSAKKPRYVETLARRGYRFIAAAEHVAAESLPPAIPSAPVGTLHAWVGQVATVADCTGGNYVLLPVDEETLQEKKKCDVAGDDLGISLLAAAEKLLLIPCGTTVKILEAHEPERGCRVRILKGQFIGRVAYAPREFLGGLAGK